MVGSRLRLKCGEDNSGRSGVGSMNDARPASASGSRAGSSSGAEVAAGWPDTSDGEAGVPPGIVHPILHEASTSGCSIRRSSDREAPGV